jgi:hypothetical protein
MPSIEAPAERRAATESGRRDSFQYESVQARTASGSAVRLRLSSVLMGVPRTISSRTMSWRPRQAAAWRAVEFPASSQ